MIEVRGTVVDEDQIDTVLPDGMEFRGRVRAVKPFMVNGRLEGGIVSTSDLYIEEAAYIRGEVFADVVVVKGSVIGPITATHTIELLAEGSVEGDLEAPEITIEEGAFHKGLCRRTGSIQE
jgi:cytoskeletal protein CcmA (bactofilin family)